MKTTPREGDYVRTAGMTIPQYHAVAKVFIDAGFSDNEYPNLAHFKAQKYFGIHTKGSGLFHGSRCGLGSILDGRELSLFDLLGDKQSMAEFLGTVPTIDSILKGSDASWSGEGLPPVGCIVEFIQNDEQDGRIYDEWFSGDKLEVISIRNVDGRPTAICFNLRHETASAMNETYFRPLKSERDIAIEEMLCAIEKVAFLSSRSAEDAFGIVYDLGYRKAEK